MKQGITQGLIAVALGLVLVTTPATAQIKWGLGIGPTVPMGTFADGFKTGFHAVGIANFDMTAKPISCPMKISIYCVPPDFTSTPRMRLASVADKPSTDDSRSDRAAAPCADSC